jgi:hypothetical protein
VKSGELGAVDDGVWQRAERQRQEMVDVGWSEAEFLDAFHRAAAEK